MVFLTFKKNIMRFVVFSLLLILIDTLLFPGEALSDTRQENTVIILPLDGRNQTYDYIESLVKICNYKPLLPPVEMMGNINDYESSFKKQWNVWLWLNHHLNDRCPVLIVSADSLVYGGLLESRNSPITLNQALNHVRLLRTIKDKYPKIKILIFSSIPRKEARQRERNLAVNMKLLEYSKDKVIDFLIISGDDVTDIPRQVKEIALLKNYIKQNKLENRVLISDPDRIRVGIDDSAMVIFMRYLNNQQLRKLRIYVEYRDITSARMKVDYYSATSIMSLAIDMINAIGAEVTYFPDNADLVLALNHPSGGRSMDDFLDSLEELSKRKSITLADVSERRERAIFFRKLYERGLFPKLAGYATWGMGTNSIGTALCQGVALKYCHDSEGFSEHIAFLYKQMLVDYIYLNNIHIQLAQKTGIPAYSIQRMSSDQERTAVELTNREMAINLLGLGIRDLIISESKKKSPKKDKEADEPVYDKSVGLRDKEFKDGAINYIPVDVPSPETVDTERKLFEWTINLPENQFAKKAKIVAGPVSFPFYRLFEIRIPVSAELIH